MADHLSLTAHAISPGSDKAARQATRDNLRMAELAYQEFDNPRSGHLGICSVLHSRATEFYNANRDALLKQEIPNIALSIDVLHNIREHNFAEMQLQKYGIV